MKNALKLREKTTIAEIAELRTILGEDRRDHPEWEIEDANWYFIDFELNRSMTHISHTGVEKSRNVADQINTIILLMRKKFPKFALEGEISVRDEFGISIYFVDSNGTARKRDMVKAKQWQCCPNCGQNFEAQK